MPELISLSYSPWSEKARWALDHHRIAYTETEHQIMLGEARLRLKARRPFGKVTVPVLIDGDHVYTDSLEIARYAEQNGRGEPLFPDPSAVELWNARSERGLAAGRVLLTERIAKDPRAKEEHLPPLLPDVARPVLRPLADVGIVFMRRKHGFDHTLRARQDLDDVLGMLREGLGRREHLLDGFSYADITMAMVLQVVKPVEGHMPLKPATERCWNDPELAEKYADLVAWRDRLFARFR